MWVWLRLKLLADVGLVGLPNAGKSTFVNAVTNAHAKVGAYPFTTLHPKLGVVRHREREFVIADIPGLIEGAAEGAGIGDRFLGHIERCRVLLHLVDSEVEDVAETYRTVRTELDAYGAGLADRPAGIALTTSVAPPCAAARTAPGAWGAGLADKPEVIALNKSDTLDEELIAALSGELEAEA